MASVSTLPKSERRTAVRLLQAANADNGPTGGLHPQLSPLGTQASRRRSACFLLPPTEIIDSVYRGGGCGAESGCSDGSRGCAISINTLAASPALLHRRGGAPLPPPDASAATDAAVLSLSPPDVTTAAADPDIPASSSRSSTHLSVPLTLLSIHNCGPRHSPRASRDVSQSFLIVSREGSFIHPADGDGGAATASFDGGGFIADCGVGAAGNWRSSSDRGSVTGSLPPCLSSSMLLRSAPLPTAAVTSPISGAGGVGLTSRPAAMGIAGGGAAACTVPRGFSNPISADAGAAGDGESAGASPAGGSIAFPSQLCSHRPPTPVCREDDLFASMRHMASPTLRRSRFASAAESSLLAAAAAAIAVEEADVLDSPVSVGFGGGGGGGETWSYHNGVGIPTEARPPRRGTLGGLLTECGESGVGGSFVVGGGGAGGGCGNSSGGLAEPSLRVSSHSTTRRTAPLLVPVPEEPLRTASQVDSLQPPNAPSTTATTTLAAAAATGDSVPAAPPPPPPPLRGPSFANAGSFPRAATPGPGLVAVGPGGLLCRRLRNTTSINFRSDGPVGPQEEAAGDQEASTPSFRCSPAGGRDGSIADGDGSALDPGSRQPSQLSEDALSSFMHSFVPPPGTPAAGRYCRLAAPADGGGAGGSGGRMPAR